MYTFILQQIPRFEKKKEEKTHSNLDVLFDI